MKRQLNSSYTLRNVRRKTDSANGTVHKASDSSPSESALTSDTLPPDLESFTTHSQDSDQDSESDEPSSEDTSSLASDDSTDEEDTEDAGSVEEEDNESLRSLHSEGITRYTDDATGITTLRRGTKPVMKAAGLPGLLDKVRNFLPQLQAANQALEEEKAAGTLSERVLEVSDDADSETYIEMNLDLGVLEERESATRADESEGELGDDESPSTKEKDIIGDLMGQKRNRRKQVEEVEDG